MGMVDRTARTPIPDQGTERDEREPTETAEILAVGPQKRLQTDTGDAPHSIDVAQHNSAQLNST